MRASAVAKATVATRKSAPTKAAVARSLGMLRASPGAADADGCSVSAVGAEHGLEWLSMRSLGQTLGVESMSLYHHVANKDDLVDGMIDLVFAEIELPLDAPDWRAAMRARALSARRVLGQHRWANGLMESRRVPGPANLRHHDAVIGCLRRAGFAIPLVAHAYAALDSYIY